MTLKSIWQAASNTSIRKRTAFLVFGSALALLLPFAAGSIGDWAGRTAHAAETVAPTAGGSVFTDEQKKALGDLIAQVVKSNTWKEILKQKGWDDGYMPADQFAAFLDKEQERVAGVMRTVGLVK